MIKEGYKIIMITLKCSTCNAEMSVNKDNNLVCPYCGTKASQTEAGIRKYKKFRRYVLDFLDDSYEFNPSQTELDNLWSKAESFKFVTSEHQSIIIYSLFTSVHDNVEMYLSKYNVSYIYPKDKVEFIDKLYEKLIKITYPGVENPNKILEKYFPAFSREFILEDGRKMIIYNRNMSYYPLEMFGVIAPELAASIMTRLENLACILGYNNIIHHNIATNSIFLNPYTKEIMLYGDLSGMEIFDKKADFKKILPNPDLIAIRQSIRNIMGPVNAKVPAVFLKFLNSEPEVTALKDFTAWDSSQLKVFGGPRLSKR